MRGGLFPTKTRQRAKLADRRGPSGPGEFNFLHEQAAGLYIRRTAKSSGSAAAGPETKNKNSTKGV
jgi:hypothetical protein